MISELNRIAQVVLIACLCGNGFADEKEQKQQRIVISLSDDIATIRFSDGTKYNHMKVIGEAVSRQNGSTKKGTLGIEVAGSGGRTKVSVLPSVVFSGSTAKDTLICFLPPSESGQRILISAPDNAAFSYLMAIGEALSPFAGAAPEIVSREKFLAVVGETGLRDRPFRGSTYESDLPSIIRDDKPRMDRMPKQSPRDSSQDRGGNFDKALKSGFSPLLQLRDPAGIAVQLDPLNDDSFGRDPIRSDPMQSDALHSDPIRADQQRSVAPRPPVPPTGRLSPPTESHEQLPLDPPMQNRKAPKANLPAADQSGEKLTQLSSQST